MSSKCGIPLPFGELSPSPITHHHNYNYTHRNQNHNNYYYTDNYEQQQLYSTFCSFFFSSNS
ncbi:hypothetical protein PP707_07480 [Acetobacter pasteurianus]|nr:hypothetical protein [Acetobacter pasteurianus]